MHEPQIGTHNRFIYMLTVGRVITTNVSQINLGQLLSRVTLKAELGYRLMFVNALGTDKFDCAKINAHFTGGGLMYGRVTRPLLEFSERGVGTRLVTKLCCAKWGDKSFL